MLATLSMVFFGIATACGFYLLLGMSVAPNGSLGAFSSFLWPTIGLYVVSFVAQALAIAQYKKKARI